MLTFPCPNCGKTLSLREEFAGNTCRCAACGQEMTVSRPSSSQIKRVPTKPPMAEEIPEVLPSSIQSANRGRGVPKWVWLISIPVVMVFVCCGGFFIIGLTKTDGRKETQESPATSATSGVNDDPEGNLRKVWLAWRTCIRKTGMQTLSDDILDKYIKQQGNPNEIMKGIRTGLRNVRGIRDPDDPIAWQETSEDGKYYILFNSGRIDQLVEDEMLARGVFVGKHREEHDKMLKDNIKRRLKENEEN